MNILVTGGAGYIGSHTCVELLQAGHEVIVIDNLCNSSREALDRVTRITGRALTFFKSDLLDAEKLDKIFSISQIEAVIHFAGLKAVGESVQKPLDYYNNNLTGTLNLCACMQKYKVKNIIFSSSATVYGDPHTVPITEDFPLSCTNPYGRTKLMIEEILTDMQIANSDWRVVLLRYFNPVGAHASGLIGENPAGIPNNLSPYVSHVAAGRLKELSVYGDDYPTPDGTGVRDYIHVIDLAQGHLAALKMFSDKPQVSIFNLGTGKGYSVLEMVKAFEKASGKPIAYQIVTRRAGDVAKCFADPTKAAKILGWKAKLDLDEMCRDTWNWQQKNPMGFTN